MIYCTYADYSFNDILYICWFTASLLMWLFVHHWYLCWFSNLTAFAHVALPLVIITLVIIARQQYHWLILLMQNTTGYISAIGFHNVNYVTDIQLHHWPSQCEFINWHSATPLAFTMWIHQLTFSHKIGFHNVNYVTDIQLYHGKVLFTPICNKSLVCCF